MGQIRVRVSEGGRVVLPARYRRALGIEVGDEIVIRLEGDELRLFTHRKAIRDAQALIRRYVPPGRSLVDELIEERGRETE